MAARKRIVHDENTRAKIQASQLINRLTDHVLGKIDMAPTQVTAALGLLKKTLPDLQAVELKAEIEETTRVINAKPISEDEWEAKYSSDLGATEGSATSTH